MKKTKNLKTRKIKPRYNRGSGDAGTINELASKTIQHETLTIRQILNRSIQGIEYTDFRTPYYEDEAGLSNYELNKINNMDEVDKLRLYSELSEKTQNLSQQIEEHRSLKAQELEASQQATQKRIDAQQGANDSNATPQ